MNKLNISLPELLNMSKTVKSHFKGEKAQVLHVDKISKKKAKKDSKKKFNYNMLAILTSRIYI